MPVHKSLKEHKIVLDTHIWIWLIQGNELLKSAFREHVNQTMKHHSILISPISVWEVSMLAAKKKIELDIDCLDWIERCLEIPGFELAPLTPKIAFQSTCLSNHVHGDPADRILIATAHEWRAILVTHDRKLLEYGQGQFINVYDPC